jgi:hypothetical protein
MIPIQLGRRVAAVSASRGRAAHPEPAGERQFSPIGRRTPAIDRRLQKRSRERSLDVPPHDMRLPMHLTTSLGVIFTFRVRLFINADRSPISRLCRTLT